MMPLGADNVCSFCGYTNNGNASYPAHILSPGTVLKERYLVGTVLGPGIYLFITVIMDKRDLS